MEQTLNGYNSPSGRLARAEELSTSTNEAFFDAGLRDIAKATGYSEGVLNSIGACSKFKHTHTFLLSVWEAMFRVLLSGFLECKKPDIISQAAMLLRHACDCSSGDDSCNPTLRLFALMLQGDSDITQSFTDYLKTMAATDDTIKFWSQFVFEECYPYVCLHLAIRSGNWHLRLESLKKMAAAFTAFDRTHYQKLIPQHLCDILRAPPEFLDHLKSGWFAVSLSGKYMHSVAIYEAHEMCINCEANSAILFPTKDNLSRVTQFFPYHSTAINNLRHQLHIRECKKGLTKYLAVHLLTVVPTVMTTPEQKFITAGPFKGDLTDLALSVTGSGLVCIRPSINMYSRWVWHENMETQLSVSTNASAYFFSWHKCVHSRVSTP